MKTIEFRENIKQKIVDFSTYSQFLKRKKEFFNTPEKVLEIIQGDFSEIGKELREKIICITDLYDKLNYIRNITEDKGFGYSNLNGELYRGISDYRFEFSETQINQLNEIANLLGLFYEDRISLLNKKSGLQNYFGEENLEKSKNLEIPLFTRLDLLESENGDLKIAEIEPIYAGIGEALGTREVFNEIGENDEFFSSLSKNYINAMKRFSGKNFLFFPNPLLSGYNSEVSYLFNQIYQEAQNFCDLDITYEEKDLDFREDGLYYKGKKVDILMNYFISKDTGEKSSLDDKILSLYYSGKIKLFPQANLELDSKLWSAIIFDENIFPENYKLKKYFPKSEIVREETVSEKGKFYKRGITRTGTKDVLNSEGFEKNYERIKDDEVLWLEQEKINTKRREVSILTKKGRLEKQNMYSRIELYLFFTENGVEIGDVLITMSPNEIVKGGRNCVMVPAFSQI